jgi:hypothetical protein
MGILRRREGLDYTGSSKSNPPRVDSKKKVLAESYNKKPDKPPSNRTQSRGPDGKFAKSEQPKRGFFNRSKK